MIQMEKRSIMQLVGGQRLQQLDGLRGVCALAVLVTHLVYGPYVVADQNIEFCPTLFLRALGGFGHLAVLIFFVLSGFVIGYTTPQKFTWEEAKRYIIRRLIRIYPIYLFAVFLSFAITNNPYTVKDVIGHLLFLQLWIVPVIKNNGSLWTLHYEFIFYLLFIVIWRLNIKLLMIMPLCIVSGILSAIFKFHPFEILGYFTLWLSGLWLAKNLVNSKLKFHHFESYRFWTPCILMAALGAQNILNMTINKYGTGSIVLTDTISVVLVTSIVAALIIDRQIYGYKLSLAIISLIVIMTISYSLYKGTFYSSEGRLFGYQLAAFFLVVLPLTFLFNKVPISTLSRLSGIGSLSYGLYVIHAPIEFFVYPLVPLHNSLTMVYFWMAGLAIAVVSLSAAWFLECYLHVRIARKLKLRLKLA